MTIPEAKRAIAVARNELEDAIEAGAADVVLTLALDLGRAMAAAARIECALWHDGCAYCSHMLRDRVAPAPESHGARRTGGLR